MYTSIKVVDRFQSILSFRNADVKSFPMIHPTANRKSPIVPNAMAFGTCCRFFNCSPLHYKPPTPTRHTWLLEFVCAIPPSAPSSPSHCPWLATADRQTVALVVIRSENDGNFPFVSPRPYWKTTKTRLVHYTERSRYPYLTVPNTLARFFVLWITRIQFCAKMRLSGLGKMRGRRLRDVKNMENNLRHKEGQGKCNHISH